MTDIVDSQTRSRMMAGIRGKDTKPELILRRSLHALGFRYRLHVKGISGKPDLVLPKYRAVIFVHGCFWHRHVGCRLTTSPGSNSVCVRPSHLDVWREACSEIQDAAVQRCGSNSSMRLAGCVGSRSSTSLKYP